jgi:hypothetical protein
MLTIYRSLDPAETGKVIALYGGKAGYSGAIAGNPTTLGALLDQFNATVLTFVDTTNTVVGGSNDSDWLYELKELYATVFGAAGNAANNSLLIAAVMHYGTSTIPADTTPPDPPADYSCASFLGANYRAIAHPDYLPLIFITPKNGDWSNELAESMAGGMDGTYPTSGQFDTPYTYVLARRDMGGGVFKHYVAAKFHRHSDYSKKAADAPPLPDVIKLVDSSTPLWTKPYAIEELRKLLLPIANSCGFDPVLRVVPDRLYTRGPAPAKVTNGSRVRFSFSEKARSAHLKDSYVCTIDDGTGPVDASAFITLTRDPEVGDSASNDGILASDIVARVNADIIAGTDETDVSIHDSWIATLTGLGAGDEGKTITFAPNTGATTRVKQADDRDFVLDPANDEAIQFTVAIAGALSDNPNFKVKLTEDFGTASARSILLSPEAGGGSSNTALVFSAARRLEVSVDTSYPGIHHPSGYLERSSDGQRFSLTFTRLVADALTEALEITTDGQYHVHLDAYATGVLDPAHPGNYVTIPASDYYFDVTTEAALLASAAADELRGWGYYPREEGLPASCAESAGGTPLDSVAWFQGAASPSTQVSGGNGQALLIGKAGGTNVAWFRRRYADGFANCQAYIEALVSCDATSLGQSQHGLYHEDGDAGNLLKLTGAGLRLRNGPYLCELVLLEDTNPSYAGAVAGKRLGMRIHDEDPAKRVYALAACDWSRPALSTDARKLIRLDFDGSSFSVSVDGVQLTMLDGVTPFSVAKERLPRVFSEDDGGDAEAAFGVFEDSGEGTGSVSEVTTEFDNLRYAFYDVKYTIGQDPSGYGADNSLVLGFHQPTRTGDPDGTGGYGPFYRSQDISVMVGASGGYEADPLWGSDTPSVMVKATVRKQVAGALTDLALPVKLRFLLADFPDASQTSIEGFRNTSTFPALGSPGLKPLGGATLSASAFSVPLGADVSEESSEIAWSLSVDRSSPTYLRRRLFILVYADSPLLDSPRLVAGANAAEYFDLSTNAGARTDPRGVIRQFLPDYFLRDSDPIWGGETLANMGQVGGSLCPDMAIGIFKGPASPADWAAHAHADPQVIADQANALYIDASSNPVYLSTYPLRFAQGESIDHYLGLNGVYEMDCVELTTDTNPRTGTIPAEKLKLTDTGWTDYDDGVNRQCYYNRIWVRLSNRGIVPGPANVQVFFMDSSIYSNFNPATARPDPAGQDRNMSMFWVWSNKANSTFVQTRFQRYSPISASGPYQVILTEAVPPLSGWAYPVASPADPRDFAVAEFIWHVNDPSITGHASTVHGCRAACINLPGQTAHTAEAASSLVDQTQDSAFDNPGNPSIWPINAKTDNVSVRNSNIIQGAAPPPAPAPDPNPVNPKCIITAPEGEPEDFTEIPDDFQPGFVPHSPKSYGLEVDAQAFPAGDVILRIPSKVLAGAKIIGFEELEAIPIDMETGQPLPGKPVKPSPRIPGILAAPAPQPLPPGLGGKASIVTGPERYLRLKGGRVGKIKGVVLDRKVLGIKQGERLKNLKLYFQIYPDAKPGVYPVYMRQTRGDERLGEYRNVVIVPKKNDLRYVADRRTGIVYDIKRYPGALKAIPFEKQRAYTDPGLAVQDRFRLAPSDAADFLMGKLKTGTINKPKGERYAKVIPDSIVLPGGLLGAVVGVLQDKSGKPIAGMELEMGDPKEGSAMAKCKTDYRGRFLLVVQSGGEEKKRARPRPPAGTKLSISCMAGSGKRRRKQVLASFACRDLCIALKPIRADLKRLKS